MENKILFGGGCFWGVQQYFDNIKGVVHSEVGYANGPVNKATYKTVSKQSGHVEVTLVIYDDDVIKLSELITLYLRIINPTSLNKQGNDVGIQYRTGIYADNKKHLSAIKLILKKHQKEFKDKILIEVDAIKNYIPAERYHQKYLDKHPMGYCHINTNDIPLKYKK